MEQHGPYEGGGRFWGAGAPPTSCLPGSFLAAKEEQQLPYEGPTRGEGAPPLPHGCLVDCLTSTPGHLDQICSKNHVPEGFIPFGLRLIFLFYETLK